MNIKQQAVSGMLWQGGSRMLNQVLDQLFTIVLVRLLAPRDFGLIAMAAVFTSLFNIFADMGIAKAVVQRAEIDDEYLSTAFWGNLGSGVVLCGVAVAASSLVARMFREPLVQPLLAALSLRFIFAGANGTQLALLSRQMRFLTISVRTLVGVVVGGVVGLSLAFAGAGAWSLVGQALALTFSGTILLWLATDWRPRRAFSWEKFKELWDFGGRVFGSRVLGYGIRNVDNLLIGRALGPTVLGYYAFAYGMFLAPLNDISVIVGRITFSAFSRLQEDLRRLRQGFLLTTRYVAFFTLPELLGFFLVAQDLITVVFGAKWLPAVPVLRLLLIAGLLRSHVNLWGSVFQAMGRTDWLLRWSFISFCVYIPAFFVGLRWGIMGVAAGYAVATVLLVPAQLRLVRRLLGFSLRNYLEALVPVVAASGLMGGCVVLSQAWLTSQGAGAGIRLAGAVGVGVASYLLAVMVIRRELVTELVRALRELRRPRRIGLTQEAVLGDG